jgi:hypothetical protein
MSMRKRLRTLLVCLMLQFGLLFGIPMRPHEIHELMQALNQPRIVHTRPEENEQGDANG